MRLEHRFALPLDRAGSWALLTDLDRVAPCLPGAVLDGVEGDHHVGKVVTRLGPMTLEYRGTIRVVEQDEPAGRISWRAEGRDARGQGRATALIEAELADASGGTEVVVVTDLDLTGRVVQLGRALIPEVSDTILAEFVRRVAAEALSTPAEGSEAVAGSEGPVGSDGPTGSVESHGPGPAGPVRSGPAGAGLDIVAVVLRPLLARCRRWVRRHLRATPRA